MVIERSQLFACSLVVLAICSHSVEAARPQEQDCGDAQVEVIRPNSPNPEKSLPENIDYSVLFDGGKRQLLRLKKQGTLSELLVHVVGHNGVISKLNTTGSQGEDVAFYLDLESRAAVTLSVSRVSQQKHHRMEGTFCHNKTLYSISHRKSMERDLSASTDSNRGNGASGGHRVSRVLISHDDSDGVESEEGKRKARSVGEAGSESLTDTLREVASRSLPGLRRRRQAVPAYTVDMMYISDYYMFQRVQAWMAGTSLPSTPNDVAREVAIMLATAANQVKLIYGTINTPTWSITTNLAAMLIVTSPEQSSWESPYNSTAYANGILTMNVGGALGGFTTWLTANGISQADHTALFTGYDIFTVSSAGVPSYSVCGLAYIGTACTTYGTAVIEFLSTTLLGQVHAHELGHSLNAQHDGYGNTCDPTQGWVMAPSQPSPTALYYNQFSSCSITSMGQYLISKPACWTPNLKPYNLSALQPAYDVPIGMRYTVNDQCRMRFGENYRALGGATYGQQVCNALRCYDKTKTYVSWIAAGRALDGTPCGDRKWCVQGSCVYNSSAPVGNNTCPLGDQSADVPIYSNSPLTCSTLQPQDCYSQSTADACCATCGRLYNATWPSCPYGDHQVCTGLWLYNCNSTSWSTTCCKYCKVNSLSIPGCPWGDYYSNCGTNRSWFCAKYPNQCCQTCASFSGK